VIDFLDRLGEALRQEGAEVRGELDSLQKNIDHIKVIVSMQQSHARSHSGVTECFAPADVIEDALKLVRHLGQRRHRAGPRLRSLPEVEADRHKLLQILTNLLSNARQALSESPRRPSPSASSARDRTASPSRSRTTGMGISEENLQKIFQHGFTPKREGHGFGCTRARWRPGRMGGR
jgi:C4-dicarboxylate-specific signal transduction histidine kinase